MPDAVSIFLFLAGVLLPAGYLALCVWMYLRKVWWFAYVAYFFVFGSFGGWMAMLAIASLGNVPMTAVPAAAMELFLLTAAMSACLISSLVLQFKKKKKDGFERGAMFGGYTYIVSHSLFLAAILLSAQ